MSIEIIVRIFNLKNQIIQGACVSIIVVWSAMSVVVVDSFSNASCGSCRGGCSDFLWLIKMVSGTNSYFGGDCFQCG
jgi:hypothetical protein